MAVFLLFFNTRVLASRTSRKKREQFYMIISSAFIRDSLETTTLTGIYSHDNFMYMIEGMDLLELFRFEKEYFKVLLKEVLEGISPEPP